jgi:hypothetical protein
MTGRHNAATARQEPDDGQRQTPQTQEKASGNFCHARCGPKTSQWIDQTGKGRAEKVAFTEITRATQHERDGIAGNGDPVCFASSRVGAPGKAMPC